MRCGSDAITKIISAEIKWLWPNKIVSVVTTIGKTMLNFRLQIILACLMGECCVRTAATFTIPFAVPEQSNGKIKFVHCDSALSVYLAHIRQYAHTLQQIECHFYK